MRAHPRYGTWFALEEDWLGKAPQGSSGPEVVTGPMGTKPPPQQAPFDGWDDVSARDLVARIEAGDVKDAWAALEWEHSHRGRKSVKRALLEVSMGAKPAEDEPSETLVDPLGIGEMPDGVPTPDGLEGDI